MRSRSPPAPTRRADDAQAYETAGLGRRTALRIVLVYCFVGAAWILFSDRLLEFLVRDDALRGPLQSVKGGFYVLATSALLYALILRARTRYRAREAERVGVLDSIADGVLVTDRAGTVVDANAAAIALAGAAHVDQVRGKPLGEFLKRARFRNLDGTPMRVEDSATWRALRGETVSGYECLLEAREGRAQHVSVSAAPVFVRGDTPERAVAVIRDVSELRRFEVVREEFLSTAAHELKTPLAVVKAYAQLMSRRGQGDPAALDAIDRQVSRLSRIVQQLLDVSRLRSGNGELRRERIDVGDVAEDVAQRMRALTTDPLRVARDGPARVNADPDRIAQVLFNLVENAIRFSPLGGEVEIAVRRRGAEALVSVRDHGVGIPRDRQERIFERFYRAHAGTADDYGGLGLGLDVSREIVARHGGRIWFESAPGQGSTFFFSLPLAAEDAA